MTCEYPNCKEEASYHFVDMHSIFCIATCEIHAVPLVLVPERNRDQPLMNHVIDLKLREKSVRYFFDVD